MTSDLSRRRLLAALAAGGVGALAACSDSGDPTPTSATDVPADTLVLRVWSRPLGEAITRAAPEFTRASGWKLQVEVRDWEDYWTSLPLDIAGGTSADVFLMNAANLAQFQVSDGLLDLSREDLPGDEAWEPQVVDLYRRDDRLWGVPMLWDVTVLLANRSLVEGAGVDPAALSFDPAAEDDPLRAATRALTADQNGTHPGGSGFDPAGLTSVGFGAVPDRAGVLGPFIAGNGGTWQDEAERFTFASPEGTAAVQYLVDMANTWHVAPPGADSAASPTLAREWFTRGRLALFQTGTYDLRVVADAIGDTLPWSVHPVVPGPAGRRPLVHGIAACAPRALAEEQDAEDGTRPRKDGAVALLAWLGSAPLQRTLAEAHLGIPAHRDARSAFTEAWTARGVDVAAALEPTPQVARPETGVRSADGTSAALPHIREAFAGTAPVPEALTEAQQAANDATA
ncbi:extracellular solute-binding protein [Brachybacterium sp. EF45031]|uniref:extracellular solute-binding protein n=1 Tax=Brachybacterium sillae TaxID=2810536 RepID=UPI00217DEBD3|nr:extracellular solute-binding protein [Brachybacterium sillae]MCS6712503.1 extracellular solute-binding protein [Brachybacterium sillae]